MVMVLKLKGSSIIEVVVAIFIISLSIALSGVLFNNVFSSSDRLLKQRAWYDVNQMLCQAELSKDTEAFIIEKNHYTLSKQAQMIDESKGLWRLQIEARQINEKVLAIRRIYLEIPTPDED
jgi:Tfp pilus assembly protein PilV